MRASLPLSVCREYFEALGDIPISDDGHIQQNFHHFHAGADREDIWRWLESMNPMFSIAKEMTIQAAQAPAKGAKEYVVETHGFNDHLRSPGAAVFSVDEEKAREIVRLAGVVFENGLLDCRKWDSSTAWVKLSVEDLEDAEAREQLGSVEMGTECDCLVVSDDDFKFMCYLKENDNRVESEGQSIAELASYFDIPWVHPRNGAEVPVAVATQERPAAKVYDVVFEAVGYSDTDEISGQEMSAIEAQGYSETLIGEGSMPKGVKAILSGEISSDGEDSDGEADYKRFVSVKLRVEAESDQGAANFVPPVNLLTAIVDAISGDLHFELEDANGGWEVVEHSQVDVAFAALEALNVEICRLSGAGHPDATPQQSAAYQRIMAERAVEVRAAIVAASVEMIERGSHAGRAGRAAYIDGIEASLFRSLSVSQQVPGESSDARGAVSASPSL